MKEVLHKSVPRYNIAKLQKLDSFPKTEIALQF